MNEIEITPYPNFEDVFIEETNRLAKFVFLPIATIKIRNDEMFGNITFHFVSIWDTGNYEKEFLGKYRTDVNEISFDLIGDKLKYEDPIIFPCIENLEQAYNIIVADFEKQKEYYLSDLDYMNNSVKMKRGQKLILDQIPNFGNFEAKYYFERITSSLLSKYRYQKFGVVNPNFSVNSFYAHLISNGKYNSENIMNYDFNTIGKINLVENLFEEPEFIQNEEFPEGTQFIGQVDESHFISSNSTNTYLFFDKKNNRQIQIFQWD